MWSKDVADLLSLPDWFYDDDDDVASILMRNDEKPLLPTYKLVIDNLDVFLRPRTETSQHHNNSLHFVHMYAVRDRINVSNHSNVPRFLGIESINLKDILPASSDLISLKKNVTTLLSRIVRKHMPYFRKHIEAKAIPQHIQHKYSKEMSQRSEVVRHCCYICYHFGIIIGSFGYFNEKREQAGRYDQYFRTFDQVCALCYNRRCGV